MHCVVTVGAKVNLTNQRQHYTEKADLAVSVYRSISVLSVWTYQPKQIYQLFNIIFLKTINQPALQP
jgi:hypothetical protein